ncbi:MAG: hypothetical protein CSA07_04055 [Bacteroidia bacterium]|nr:MAG: hypothetical protein CSA07_04055 [Bacteroidia bacterium]
MDEKPKLRSSSQPVGRAPYPLNAPTQEVVERIGLHFIYLHGVGKDDLQGEDWAEAFRDAIGGQALGSNLGIADVGLGRYAWSLKTIKRNSPSTVRTIRLIVGRCSPDYSYGISDPHADVAMTGEAVLKILNARIEIALEAFPEMRTAVLIRSGDMREYVLFEASLSPYRTEQYEWAVNSNGNFIARHTPTQTLAFTWQPHGAQLTHHLTVPQEATHFTINLPQRLGKVELLQRLGADATWVSISR